MTLQFRGLLLAALGATLAVAQPVPKALEQSNTLNSLITKDGTNSFRFFRREPWQVVDPAGGNRAAGAFRGPAEEPE